MSERLPNPIEAVKVPKGSVLSSLFTFRHLAHSIAITCVDLLYPPRCAGCGRIDSHWCANCGHEAEDIPFHNTIKAVEPLQAVAATGTHSGILRQAVQALKYENAREVAVPLGKRLTDCLAEQNWMIDTIIPVPLHTQRLKERGYNQAQLLAEQVAKMTGIYCHTQTLARIRNTRSQVTVSGAERKLNLQDAFMANPISLQQHIVLLIDDVYTTGATMSACAEALIAAGAQAVYGLTVTAAGI